MVITILVSKSLRDFGGGVYIYICVGRQPTRATEKKLYSDSCHRSAG